MPYENAYSSNKGTLCCLGTFAYKRYGILLFADTVVSLQIQKTRKKSALWRHDNRWTCLYFELAQTEQKMQNKNKKCRGQFIRFQKFPKADLYLYATYKRHNIYTVITRCKQKCKQTNKVERIFMVSISLNKLNIFLATLDGVTADLNKIKLFLLSEKTGTGVQNQESKNDRSVMTICPVFDSKNRISLVFWPCKKSDFKTILKLIWKIHIT